MSYSPATEKKNINRELAYIAGLIYAVSVIRQKKSVRDQELNKEIKEFKKNFFIATVAILANYKKIFDGVVYNTVVRNHKRVKKLKSVAKRISQDALLKDANAKALQFKRVAANNLEGVMKDTSNYWESQFRRLNESMKANEGLARLSATNLRSRDALNSAMVKRVVKERGKIIVNGKKWDSEKYYKMLFRTETSRLRSVVTLANANKYNADLLKVSVHNTQCSICQAYEGKVFSKGGKNKDFPPLDDAPPYHPNCQHYLTIVFEDALKAAGNYDGEKAFSRGVANRPPNTPSFIPIKER